MPLFSIIMPAYNREKYIGSALSSVVAQTCDDWECIVVDDGSSDSTCVIAGKFAAVGSNFHFIQQANSGPGAARNRGVAHAKGRYLAFLDSDDVLARYALETYRDALERSGWPEYLAAQLQTFSNDTETKSWTTQPMRTDVFPDALIACDQGQVIAGAGLTIVSADAFRRVGGFLEDRLNAEDHDFTLRLGDCRGFAAVRAPVTVGYRRHGEQESSSQDKAVEGTLRLVDREKSGLYPGGEERASQRRSIIAAHARPICLAALNNGEPRLAWRLYRATFAWQLKAKRWRFLIGFPVVSLGAILPMRRET